MPSQSVLLEEESVKAAFWAGKNRVEGLAPPGSQVFWSPTAGMSGSLPGPHFLSKNMCVLVGILTDETSNCLPPQNCFQSPMRSSKAALEQGLQHSRGEEELVPGRFRPACPEPPGGPPQGNEAAALTECRPASGKGRYFRGDSLHTRNASPLSLPLAILLSSPPLRADGSN